MGKEYLKKDNDNFTLKQQNPERQASFSTDDGIPIERFYTPSASNQEYIEKIGNPGEFPFTRGIHSTMYRGRHWTTRMFAGFGTAEETNKRFKYLLSEGQDGLSVAFDMLTLYGYDTDNPHALLTGEFGHGGVACSSLEDMEVLFDGIPLDQVSVSMTINSPAAPIWAMYLANAEKQGIAYEKLRGTIQNDILKEYIAQKEYIFPPEPSLRLVVDTIEFSANKTVQFNPISVSGYHIREKGSTAVQELAFTLANGFTYIDECLKRGLDIDQVAPKLSFFFNIHNNFFEEIAKFRAARRIWARQLQDRYLAKDPKSMKMRIHAQTSGHSLTAQQPENNIVRVTLQALAAVFGGAQSLHTDAMDEALALPSEKAALIALRTQQILKYESGIADTADPLGGAPFIEKLTDQIEEAALVYFDEIARLGGVVPAIKRGYFERVIVDASDRYQKQVDRGEKIIVGVNKFQDNTVIEIPILEMDPKGHERQIDKLKKLRSNRSNDAVIRSLARLTLACKENKNVMPYLIDAAKSYATLGEMMAVMREVFGEYQEPLVI